jgi:hypothetical protein
MFWWQGVFDYRHVPYSAAEFMAPQKAVFEPLRLYNEWTWGGYLEWRLRPWFQAFADGRYIFHDQILRSKEVFGSPERWAQFMDAERLDGAMVPNFGLTFPERRLGRDGKALDISRPWYHFFFPRQRWAMVYWDDQILLLVDRRRVPASWLAAHEYRFLLPWDEANLGERIRQGQVSRLVAAEELRRHGEEMQRRGRAVAQPSGDHQPEAHRQGSFTREAR